MNRFMRFLIIFFLFTSMVRAQIPRFINYQGKLMGMDEKPVPEGNYQLTFKIYDEASNLLWTEVHPQVFIGGGLFQVTLGTITPLNIPFEKPYFLSIQVGSDPEIQPRIMLTSAAYALRAEDANQLMGFKVSPNPEPNKLLPLDNNGKFPPDVLAGNGGSGDYLKRGVPDTSRGNSADPMLLISNFGTGNGINGRSIDGIGVSGRSESSDGVNGWTGAADKSGVAGSSTNGKGVNGRSENGDGVVGWTGAAEKSGVFGHTENGFGVSGLSAHNHGISGTSTSRNIDYGGVYGYAQDCNGVKGKSVNYVGVYGSSVNNNGVVGTTGVTEGGAYSGVWGWSVNGTGVRGTSDNYVGIQATTKSNTHAALAAGNEGAGPAIYAQAGSGKVAAVFRGNVEVQSLTTQAKIIELGEGLDYAEGFDLSHNLEIAPGTVLIIDPENPGKLKISSEPYDRKVAGIVAGAKGLGSGVQLGGDRFDQHVALAGRVYCNVDAGCGAVNPGDLLTTSATPGYAMIVKNHSKAQGAILGKAMESLPKGHKGQILVLVTLQ